MSRPHSAQDRDFVPFSGQAFRLGEQPEEAVQITYCVGCQTQLLVPVPVASDIDIRCASCRWKERNGLQPFLPATMDDSEGASRFDEAWRDEIVDRARFLIRSAARFSATLARESGPEPQRGHVAQRRFERHPRNVFGPIERHLSRIAGAAPGTAADAIRNNRPW